MANDNHGSHNADLPAGWVWTTLDDACDIIMGQSPPSETYNTEGVGLPFYQGKAEFGALSPTSVKWCSQPGKIAEAGDVLITVRAPVGPTNLCREKSCIGRGLAAICPQKGMPSLYILYLLRSIVDEIAGKATGTTFSAISGKVLHDQEIPLAPLPEQHRIVAKIEELFTRLDAGVAALKRAQANLKRYKAAVLKAACEGRLVAQDASDEPASVLLERILVERRAKWETDLCAKGKDPQKAKCEEPQAPNIDELPGLASGWCWASVEQLLYFMTSGSRGWAKHYAESGALFVRVGNFNRLSTTLDIQNPTFVDAPQGAEADRTRLQINDLLITMTADVGMIGIVDERALQWGEAYINQHVGLVRFVVAELCPFVAWVFASELVQAQFLKKQYGATKLGLGFEEIKSIHVPLPPLAEQRRIVAEVERRLSVVQELEATLAVNLARAGRLRQSILKRAFEGKLG
jgi:type I restriction enzyme, S subunit